MNAAYSPRKSFEFDVILSIPQMIMVLEGLRKTSMKEGLLISRLDNALHDVLCSQRMDKKDLIEAKDYATRYELQYILNDCNARLRNLAAN